MQPKIEQLLNRLNKQFSENLDNGKERKKDEWGGRSEQKNTNYQNIVHFTFKKDK